MTDPEARMIGRITQLTTENEALRMRADTTLSPELLQQIAILRGEIEGKNVVIKQLKAQVAELQRDHPSVAESIIVPELRAQVAERDAENARLREQSNERFSEIERARRIITELTQWRESWLTRPKRSTRQMRDRAVELATPPRDDFDRAVLAIIADVEAEDDARRAALTATPAIDLAAENARLWETLAPFAALADAVLWERERDGTAIRQRRSDDPDNRIVWGYDNASLTLGDMRRVAALSPPQQAGSETEDNHE